VHPRSESITGSKQPSVVFFPSFLFACGGRKDAKRVREKEAFGAMKRRERKLQREKLREREVCCTHM
jgi:hypothetical protein